MDKKYQDSMAWQRAMSLVEKIYDVTREMPESEKYCLILMMREAAISVVSGIKKAYRCLGSDTAHRSIDDALGSAAALESHLLVTESLELVPNAHLIEPKRCVGEVRRLLTGLYEAFVRYEDPCDWGECICDPLWLDEVYG